MSRTVESVRGLMDRVLAIAKTEGGEEKLKKLGQYVLRLESRAKLGQAIPVYSPCTTLRQYRLQLKLTQPMLAVLANTYAGMVETGYSYPEIARHLRRLKDSDACIDRTYLSHFETGAREPWERVSVVLAEVFSILLDRNVSRDELFPEVRRPTRPGKKTQNQRFTRAAIEYTREQLNAIARDLDRLPPTLPVGNKRESNVA